MNLNHEFFVSLWDKRERQDEWGNYFVICFETGQKLWRNKFRANSFCYSHILPKHLYPQYKLKEWNIVIVHPEAHAQYESFTDLAPKQKALYDKYIGLINKGKL